jgi:hypothetical protein
MEKKYEIGTNCRISENFFSTKPANTLTTTGIIANYPKKAKQAA